MYKNVASQKLTVYVFDSTTNLPKTGDAANLTAYLSKDYAASATVLGDTSATEVDATNAKGYYQFDLTQAETNADQILFTCKSSTANTVCLCMPAVVFTTPNRFTTMVIDANGLVDSNTVKVGPTGSGTAQTARDLGATLGAAGAGLTAVPWNAAWDAEVQSEVQDAIEVNNLDHFMAVAVTNSDVVNNSALAKLASKSATATWSSFTNTTDSLEKTADQIALITPVSNVSDSGTITYGTQISGTYANTDTDDDNRWVLAPVAVNGLDVYMAYAAGTDRAPTTVQINGYWQGNSAGVHVWAWDYHTSAWAQLSNASTRMQSRSSDTNYSYALSREHMDADGAVQIRFTSASVTTTDRLRLDRVLVNSVSEASGGIGSTDAQGVWEYADRQLTALGIEVTVDAASIAAIQSGLATSSALSIVDGIVDDILVDTGTTIPAQVSGLNDLSAAEVNAEVDTALVDVGLTTTVTGRIDAAISTRSTYAGADTAGTTTLLSRVPDTISLAAINAQADTALSDAGVTTVRMAHLDADVSTAGISAAQVNAEVDAALLDVGLTTTVTGRIDAAVSSRMATFTLPSNFSALSITAAGLVSFDPAATAFDGVVPNLAFFTNSGVGSAASVTTTLRVVQSGEAGGQG